jgi:prophage regulatory protein
MNHKNAHEYQILKAKEVSNLIKISTTQIYRLINKGNFPRPYQISERSVGWRLSDIAEWLNSKSQTSKYGGQNA